jgi:predicted RNA-binding Zn-ribbon protein involved in translation (DUF1610 family)
LFSFISPLFWSVTLIVALKTDPFGKIGVLMASDSMVVLAKQHIKRFADKVRPVIVDRIDEERAYALALLGRAGDRDLGKMFMDAAEEYLREAYERGTEPFSRKGLSTIVNGLRDKLIEVYNAYKATCGRARASLILGTVLMKEQIPRAAIYVFKNGIPVDRSDEGVVAVGSGRGFVLIFLRLLSAIMHVGSGTFEVETRYPKELPLTFDPPLLGVTLIDAAAAVCANVSEVQSPGDVWWLRRPFDDERKHDIPVAQSMPRHLFEEYKQRTKKRLNAFRLFWMACDRAGEDAVVGALMTLAFPKCPHCGSPKVVWVRCTPEERRYAACFACKECGKSFKLYMGTES